MQSQMPKSNFKERKKKKNNNRGWGISPPEATLAMVVQGGGIPFASSLTMQEPGREDLSTYLVQPKTPPLLGGGCHMIHHNKGSGWRGWDTLCLHQHNREIGLSGWIPPCRGDPPTAKVGTSWRDPLIFLFFTILRFCLFDCLLDI